MPKFLVVYYSRTGHTEQVAKALAEKLGADLEPIREKRSRLGFLEYWRSGRESFLGILPTIEPSQHDPAGYDLVILGSPVWASQPSTPMRAYLAAHNNKLNSIACFVTLGGSGAQKTLARMADAAGKPAIATFSATERELKTGAWMEGLEQFVGAITGKG
ncbi:flavodoxin family protein [Oricola nitratireducens]|uniref:flavodoxin family protein n=1 Tax=Oricola nitratireducens TaxID=2775868 RepID=UPI00186843B9|nr:flavodoxin [Oricola nitratireducens]